MRLIDADKMLEEVRTSDAVLYERRGVINLIERMPTAVRVVKRRPRPSDYEAEGFEMFLTLSIAFYGRMMYFLQDDGTVFSQVSHKYMTKAEAYNEFTKRLREVQRWT